MTGPWRPAGTANFRDLGGLPTDDGQIRPGLLFRSDTLQELTADDVDVLVRRLGLRLVVDLRAPEEVAGEGRGLLEAEPVRHVNLALHSRDQRPIPDLTADTWSGTTSVTWRSARPRLRRRSDCWPGWGYLPSSTVRRERTGPV